MSMLKFNNTKNINNNIKVIGVGGGGSNAVDNMFREGIKDVDFIVANTDAQALEQSSVPVKIQLGKRGKGAGNNPEVGKEAALESVEQIKKMMEDETEMVFITAGMGGGTGTGGAPVIASIARDLEILTVGIVTSPFNFEGPRRKKQAEAGIAELRKYVDTMLIIVNDRLRELHLDMKMSEAFRKADNILTTAAKGIAELVTVPGNINLDFEDVKSVMQNGGKALMSSATADGEDRALECAELVLNSPLLADSTIKGAENILLYLASSSEKEMSVNEMHDITDYIEEKSGGGANLIFGNSLDDSLGDSIRITLVATGFDKNHQKEQAPKKIRDLYGNGEGKAQSEESYQQDDSEPVIKQRLSEEQEENPSEEPTAEQDSTPASSNQARTVHQLFSEDEDTDYHKADQNTEGDDEYNQKPEARESDAASPRQYNGDFDDDTESDNSTKYGSVFDDDGEVGNFQFTTRKKERKPENHTEQQQKKANDRIAKLAYTGKIPKRRRPTEKEREKMENVPAYKRRKVDLDETQASDDENDPEYVLGKNKNDETVIKKNNGYIHKNID